MQTWRGVLFVLRRCKVISHPVMKTPEPLECRASSIFSAVSTFPLCEFFFIFFPFCIRHSLPATCSFSLSSFSQVHSQQSLYSGPISNTAKGWKTRKQKWEHWSLGISQLAGDTFHFFFTRMEITSFTRNMERRRVLVSLGFNIFMTDK